MNLFLDFSNTGNGSDKCFGCGQTFSPDNKNWRDSAVVGDVVHCSCDNNDCNNKRCANPVVATA